MENKKLIIFDFDGVLVNTADFWFQIHKEANADFTYEKMSILNYGNFLHTYDNLLSTNKHVQPKDPEVKYIEALNTVFSIEDILHDAILKLANDYTLCICSSASAKIISDFIAKENLQGCFADILGYEAHSSKIVKINSLLEKYKVENKDTIFITDTLGDVLEGKECGVNLLGVTWGIHKREILERGSPAFIIDSPVDLLPAIGKML